ncbi:MAG: hypothetical protein HN341_06135 [Verrucomicrobia bacterium]|jgi:CO dehydrogenase/acetyl-CoA synthase delta subunit|nr:hypothetical protein [Verrucomicrobiota bacterium]
MMTRKRWGVVGVSIAVAAVTVYAGSKLAEDAVNAAHWILGKSATYSEKESYSKTIEHVLLGHDAAGTAQQGVAMRSFKTYERVTALIALKRDGAQVVVDVVDIPDIGVIKDVKKQLKVLEALKGMAGTVVQDAEGKSHPIDAVTGATRYQKRIFLYMNKMAEALLSEMDSDPGWPKTPVKAR